MDLFELIWKEFLVFSVAAHKSNKPCLFCFFFFKEACSNIWSDRKTQLDFTVNKRPKRSLSWDGKDQTTGLFPVSHVMKFSKDPPHNLTLLLHNTTPAQGLSFHFQATWNCTAVCRFGCFVQEMYTLKDTWEKEALPLSSVKARDLQEPQDQSSSKLTWRLS